MTNHILINIQWLITSSLLINITRLITLIRTTVWHYRTTSGWWPRTGRWLSCNFKTQQQNRDRSFEQQQQGKRNDERDSLTSFRSATSAAGRSFPRPCSSPPRRPLTSWSSPASPPPPWPSTLSPCWRVSFGSSSPTPSASSTGRRWCSEERAAVGSHQKY